jgi:hypothetical protein
VRRGFRDGAQRGPCSSPPSVPDRERAERWASTDDYEADEYLAELGDQPEYTEAELREALAGLLSSIATPETAKHRLFVFLDAAVLPEHKLIATALDDAYHLGVLSSRVHRTWADAAGGRLGVGDDPVYNKTRCFEPFPFPGATEARAAEIRRLGEAIGRHWKRR